MNELERVKTDKESEIAIKVEQLTIAEAEPQRVSRQTEAIDKANESMEVELRGLQRKIKGFEQDIEKQAKRKTEAEKLRKSLLEKLEQNRQTIEQREQDVAVVKTNLESMKALHHDLVTRKVELNVRRKECDSELRHRMDQLK